MDHPSPITRHASQFTSPAGIPPSPAGRRRSSCMHFKMKIAKCKLQSHSPPPFAVITDFATILINSLASANNGCSSLPEIKSVLSTSFSQYKDLSLRSKSKMKITKGKSQNSFCLWSSSLTFCIFNICTLHFALSESVYKSNCQFNATYCEL